MSYLAENDSKREDIDTFVVANALNIETRKQRALDCEESVHVGLFGSFQWLTSNHLGRHPIWVPHHRISFFPMWLTQL